MIKDIPQSLLNAVIKVLNESTEHPMIEVDGVMKHRNNSEGKPIHPTEDGIRNFHRWFGDSKAVDEHGRPQVYYRGSQNPNAEAYNKNSMIFLTKSPELANIYARNNQVFKVYAKTEYPFDISRGQGLKHWKDFVKETNAPSYSATGTDRGMAPHWQQEYNLRNWLTDKNIKHDSIYFGENNNTHSLAVRDINQIKSAIGNSGAFSHPTKITESINHPMIEVDGVMRHRHNSLGQPIHPTEEGIKNFHRWFGDSKAVDEHGRPQVFYHGTASDIKQFHPSFLGHGLDQYGTGFYFADSPYIANSYVHGNSAVSQTAAPNVLPVYLSIKSPINTSDDTPFKREHIKKLIQAAPNHRESLENFGDISYDGYNKVLNDAIKSHLDTPKHTAMNYINNDFYSDHPQEFVKNLKQITGHSGVVNDRDEQRIVTVFDPKDIKSAIGNNGKFSSSENITEGKK